MVVCRPRDSSLTCTDMSVSALLNSQLIPVEELSSGSSDYAASTWISWFLSTKGNEYFCELDEDYILDRFNLTGLNTEVHHYVYALDLITDALGVFRIFVCANPDEQLDESQRDQIESQARILYGLIHARYIVTTRGLAKMVRFEFACSSHS